MERRDVIYMPNDDNAPLQQLVLDNNHSVGPIDATIRYEQPNARNDERGIATIEHK